MSPREMLTRWRRRLARGRAPGLAGPPNKGPSKGPNKGPNKGPGAGPGDGLRRAFTLIELLVVLAIVALLASLAVPSYFSHVERTRETILRENLHRVRDALDTFHADLGRYPESLEELVSRRYLRAIPSDPVTGKTTTWVVVPPPTGVPGKVGDVHSGAPGLGRDGTPYGNW